MPSKRLITPRRAALAGIAGPAIFATTLVTTTILQYDFMLGIGWKPLSDPSGAWPSGLSLGPHGWIQDLNFAISGTLLATFAIGLHRGMGYGSKTGPALLFVAATAMALLAFRTDPIVRTGPRSLHGTIHDAAFVVFVVSLLLALVFVWHRMQRNPAWRNHARYALATAVLTPALLALPGIAYYLFLVVVLGWFEVTAVKLWRHAGSR